MNHNAPEATHTDNVDSVWENLVYSRRMEE